MPPRGEIPNDGKKIALARRMRALAGRETTDVNTTRGIAIVTRMRLARAKACAYTATQEVSRKGYQLGLD